MPLPKCSQCGKELSDPVSIAQEIGPDCLAKRAQSLAAAGSSETEICQMAASDDPTVARWARIVLRAIADGNLKHAERFIEAARRAKAFAQMPIAA